MQMNTRKLLREILSELRGGHYPFSVCQNRHIKISVTNPENAQTAMLIVGVSSSDVNADKASMKQCRRNLQRIGVTISN
jgi:hypothetical protein